MSRQSDEIRMSLGDHIEELRQCLLRALAGVLVGMVVCLLFGKDLMALMTWPMTLALRSLDLPVQLRVLAPAEAFMTYLKVCLIAGAILAGPYSLYQLWKFIAAGLYDHERRFVYRFIPFSVALFVLGAVFFFLVVGPICLRFFVQFSQENFVAAEWTNPIGVLPRGADAQATSAPSTAPAAVLPILADDPPDPAEGQMWMRHGDPRVFLHRNGRTYQLLPQQGGMIAPDLRLADVVSFVALMTLVFGLGFQMPIVVLALAGSGIVELQTLRRVRWYVLLGILVVSAMITPPDVASQIALALPMQVLYELGLLLAKLNRRKKPAS